MSLSVQVFATPKRHHKSKPFFDHVISFSVADGRIWLRNYQVLPDPDKKATATAAADSVSLVEVRRSHQGGEAGGGSGIESRALLSILTGGGFIFKLLLKNDRCLSERIFVLDLNDYPSLLLCRWAPARA